MRYVSTRASSSGVAASHAIGQSLAGDGGLFVPERFPSFSAKNFDGLAELPKIAHHWLAPFFEGDALADSLEAICDRTFQFPIPITKLDDKTELLELFHGPTLAFKDVGARFLAECLERLPEPSGKRRTILVATSGDTGGAVAAAFHRRAGFDVLVLFPKGRVSPTQQTQLTCWGDNVRALSVRGDFDDCQRLVKAAFAQLQDQAGRRLISANSINLGRLLPQGAYYVAASLEHQRRTGRAAAFVIPTGNLGNATAALWAKRTGLPIARVVLATNANRAISTYFDTGEWKPLATLTTPANAMDVGNPSNMERLRHLYPERDGLLKEVGAISASNDEIREAVLEAKRRWQKVICPHTATAVHALKRLPPGDWILAATAHAAKFREILEPWLGEKVTVPEALSELLSRKSHVTEIEPDLEALRTQLSVT